MNNADMCEVDGIEVIELEVIEIVLETKLTIHCSEEVHPSFDECHELAA